MFQKAWDTPKTKSAFDLLLSSATDERDRARLLAMSCKDTGLWLQAPPSSSVGLRMDDEVIRVASGLRLGVPLCTPHTCHQCGAHVDELATHGLSCRRSQGRHSRHASLNALVQRFLSAAGIPSRLEPCGTDPGSGARPDGVSLVPWKFGKPLAWDATCRDTFAPSYLKRSALSPGTVALEAEEQKKGVYRPLSSTHVFVPIAVETSGIIGPSAMDIFKLIGRKLRVISGDPLSNYYIRQQVAVCIQRGNTAAILGSLNNNVNNHMHTEFDC